RLSEPHLQPVTEWTGVRRPLERAIGLRRRDDLIAPALAAHPAFALKLTGGKRKRIGDRTPNIDLAVAISVDRVFEILSRHRLGEAEGPGPGRFHVRARNALLQHLERRNQLVVKPLLPLADIGERCEHADRIVFLMIGPVSRLPAPDGNERVAIDT